MKADVRSMAYRKFDPKKDKPIIERPSFNFFHVYILKKIKEKIGIEFYNVEVNSWISNVSGRIFRIEALNISDFSEDAETPEFDDCDLYSNALKIECKGSFGYEYCLICFSDFLKDGEVFGIPFSRKRLHICNISIDRLDYIFFQISKKIANFIVSIVKVQEITIK